MTAGTTRYKCPMPDCDWSYDLPLGGDPMDAERAIGDHMTSSHDDHSVLEYLRTRIIDQREQQPAAEAAPVDVVYDLTEAYLIGDQVASAALYNTVLRRALRAEAERDGHRLMAPADETPIQKQMRSAVERAHDAEAKRADAQAALLYARAENEAIRARESRALAAAANDHAALTAVRRHCTITTAASPRVQAREQAQDVLKVIDGVTAGKATTPDGAWGAVWIEGDWRWITMKMSTEQREYAADCVARWMTAMDKDAGAPVRDEPAVLRWWRGNR